MVSIEHKFIAFAWVAMVAMLSLQPASALPLKVAIVSRTVFYVPLWMAKERGYFHDQGLDVDISVYDNAEKINADLVSGAVQIAISTPESVMVDAYHGGKLRIIAANAERLPHFIITKPEIKDLAGMKGAKFGVLSMQEGTTYLVQEIAKAAGLKPEDVRIEAVGGAPTRARLLKEGKIDGGLQPFPLSYEAESEGFTNLGPVSRFVPDYLFTSVNVNGDWAVNNQSRVIAFLSALKHGQDYMFAHVDEAARIAGNELKTSPALAARALGDTATLRILSPNLRVSEPSLTYVFQILQKAGLIDASATYDRSRMVDDSYVTLSQTLSLADIGSFYLGGKQKSVRGQPVKEIKYAAAAPPMRVDPNGTYAVGQLYVQFARAADPASLPILFLNGGTSTGAMWETTPDGRAGWQSYFLHRGYSTYLTDAVGKGRASWAMYPEVLNGAPTFRPNEETWKLLRIGTRYSPEPAERAPFPGSQFPVDAFDEFAKQGVPRFAGQDAAELDAYRLLIKRVCPCVIASQSSGSYFASILASEQPELVSAIVGIEMTAVPDLAKIDAAALSRVPQLIFWGDNINGSPFWEKTRQSFDNYATALNKQGGAVTTIDLPDLAIRGNTHQMMMDRNNLEIAKIAADWLEEKR